MQREIETLILTFFEKLSITIDSIQVIQDENNICNISIKTPESGLLIGQSGKTLESIKLVLKIMILNSYDISLKIHIEVNDYLSAKDNRLKYFVDSKIELIEKTTQDIILPFFSAYERKKIHTYIQESGKKHISTKSIGEGPERRMHICIDSSVKSRTKLSIDIDSNDI